MKIKSAQLKAEIAHILGSDTASLKQVFSLIGELEVVTRELHLMESSMRRAYVREILEQRLASDRALQLIVQRLRHEFRVQQRKELEKVRDSLWIYYLIIMEMKIWEVPSIGSPARSLEPKPSDRK
ncbi:hypothetical protein [Vibrio nomapromontoriensis]|uniref:hypothetical protein n=1 Tax=Vibrio nomapromontoriensis TaxID=2910246 RepID=UPI003D12FB50